MGLKSLPAMLGTDKAARLACWVMGVPQVVVIGLLIYWGVPLFGALVAAVLTVQIYLMFQLLESPREKAPWYNATGISLYVSGMMASAFALQNLLDGGL